jgi:hypothetical protein
MSIELQFGQLDGWQELNSRAALRAKMVSSDFNITSSSFLYPALHMHFYGLH